MKIARKAPSSPPGIAKVRAVLPLAPQRSSPATRVLARIARGRNAPVIMGGVHLGIGSDTGRVPSTAPARIPSHTGGPVQSTHCDRVDDCWDPWREPIAAAMAGYNTTTVRRLVGGHR